MTTQPLPADELRAAILNAVIGMSYDIQGDRLIICSRMGGTGGVHSIDGEWRGRCICPAGRSPE